MGIFEAIKELGGNDFMEQQMTYNGFRKPQAGEGGPHICCKCGNNFHHKGNKIFFDLFRSPVVRCPKCKSLNTKRDPKWLY